MPPTTGSITVLTFLQVSLTQPSFHLSLIQKKFTLIQINASGILLEAHSKLDETKFHRWGHLTGKPLLTARRVPAWIITWTTEGQSLYHASCTSRGNMKTWADGHRRYITVFYIRKKSKLSQHQQAQCKQLPSRMLMWISTDHAGVPSTWTRAAPRLLNPSQSAFEKATP